MISKFSIVNSTKLHYHLYPKENRDTIIFLHFGGSNLAMWTGVLPYFTDGWQILAPDLRGHGKSEKTESGYQIDTMAQDIVALMDQIGIQKAHIVGCSIGAELAVSMARYFPERIQSIVCDGALYNLYGEYGLYTSKDDFIDYKQKTKTRIENQAIQYYNSLEERIAEMRSMFEQYQLPFGDHVEKYMEYSTIEEGGKFKDITPPLKMEYFNDFWEIQFEKYYQEISCSVLFLPSEQDLQDPRKAEILDAFAAMVNSRVICINGGFHPFIPLTHPKEYADTILQFAKHKLID